MLCWEWASDFFAANGDVVFHNLGRSSSSSFDTPEAVKCA